MIASILCLAMASSVPSDLGIEVRSRALVPGELARVVVVSPVPLRSVEGTLRGEALEFASLGGLGTAWTAWAAIDLDARPGPAMVRARGVEPDGREVLGRRQLTIGSKAFPLSELMVEPKYVEPPPEELARIEREKALLAEVYARRTEPRAVTAGFVRPVPGEPTSTFGARRVFNGQKRAPHAGLDLRAATGTPVSCSGPGTVALARDLYFSGNTVIVDHGAGLFTVYAHLSEMRVQAGAEVDAGDVVGLSGATGRVTGPHLHWGGKVGARIFDPTSLLEPELFAPVSADGIRRYD
jgi:murein DD-endopeptidase MepM/ murein hydrolase activator NlpD